MARFDLFLLSAFALALEGNVLVLFPAPLDNDNAASVLDTARLVLFPGRASCPRTLSSCTACPSSSPGTGCSWSRTPGS